MSDSGAKILLCDDEQLSRELITRRLVAKGFHVDAVADGLTCLAYVRQHPPDLVLLDVSMPGMDGITVLRQLRFDWSQDRLPVILVTAMVDSEDVVAGLDAGANDYVVKPVTMPVLIARMKVGLRVKEAVTERMLAEQALRDTQQAMRKINEDLDQRVRQRTAELDESNRRLTEEVHQRRLVNEQLLEHQQKLRALAAQAADAEQQERHRIASGLHDQVGQALALAKMRLGALHQVGGDVAAVAAEVRKSLNEAIAQVRSLTFELSSRVLYEFGLEAAIENLVEQLQQHGIRGTVEDDGAARPLDQSMQVVLYQAVRELLHNILKHAGAENVRVGIVHQEANLRIVVEDDGVGCDASRLGTHFSPGGGFGLFNIRERLTYLGGSFTAESTPGRGTRVTLTAPLNSK